MKSFNKLILFFIVLIFAECTNLKKSVESDDIDMFDNLENNSMRFEFKKCPLCAYYYLEFFSNNKFIFIDVTQPSNIVSIGNYKKIGKYLVLNSQNYIDTNSANVNIKKYPIRNKLFDYNYFTNDTLEYSNGILKVIDFFNQDTIPLKFKNPLSPTDIIIEDIKQRNISKLTTTP